MDVDSFLDGLESAGHWDEFCDVCGIYTPHPEGECLECAMYDPWKDGEYDPE